MERPRSSRAVRGSFGRRVAAFATGVAAALIAAFAAPPAPASQPADTFRGAADIILGDTVHAAFPANPPGPHRYTFYAQVGTTVSASVKVDAGVQLSVGLRLATPGGQRMDTGAAQRNSPGGPKITNFKVTYAGYYVFEVVPKSGSGGYTMSTRRTGGTKYTNRYPDAPADAYFRFYAPIGANLTVLVGPLKTGPKILITGLTAPDGSAVPILSVEKGDAAEISRVPTTETGQYAVAWKNSGALKTVKLTFTFELPPPSAAVREFGTSDGQSVTVVETGDPTGAARAGYVGSAACGRCHSGIVAGWSVTAHNAGVRAWNRAGLSNLFMVNDVDGNGADDFHDGLDLATTPAFTAYGANAPKLLYAAAAPVPYQAKIGTITYTVDRTMGGNGLFAQRYLTKLGASYFVLPFEYDEAKGVYAVFSPDDWYDAEGNPRNVTAASAQKERSFEAQCSGCHNTGEMLSGGTSAFTTGYVELNVGCEQCHGPGAEHAVQGDTRKIMNPANLLDGTAAGAAAADGICARCHTKGTSVDPLPGTETKSGFGFLASRGIPQAGDAPKDFLVPTNDPNDFWGFKTNPLPSVPGDSSVGARVYPMQGNDIAVGEHAPDVGYAPTCFDCHDPHARLQDHQVATSVDRGVYVATKNDDNSLCLACHAGDEKFPNTSKADAALISTGVTPASVSSAVVDHMKDAGMPVSTSQYDPAGTGVGRCSICHMPQTPTVGAPLTDAAGYAAGDLDAHRFEVVWPRASVLYGVTNSCNACHPTSGADPVATIIDQWANPAPAGSTTAFHGATPPANEVNVPLNGRANPANGGGVLCISCHTAEGFARVAVNGEALPQDEIDKIAKEGVAQDRGVSCDGCHGKRADGQFYGSDPNPLRIDKTELCATCHNNRTIVFDDFRDHGAIVRHPQREMLAGNAGSTPPGIPDTATTSHSYFANSCVTCHYDTGRNVETHHFTPNTTTCAGCHPGLNTFNRPANGDYDGDGVVEGIQDEVKGLLDVLKTALLADPQMSFSDGFFDYAGGADHALTGASDVQKRGVFNWYTVSDDRSFGVHNVSRAVQLLQASYRELTGHDVPGAKIR
jgi:hypothetical protein